MKKFIVLLAIVALAAALCGCSGAGGETPATEEKTLPADGPEYTMVSSGAANYTVVIPKSGGCIKEIAAGLCEELEKIYGAVFRYTSNAAGALPGQRFIRVAAQPEKGDPVPYDSFSLVVEESGDITVSAWSEKTLRDVCARLALRLSQARDDGDAEGKVTDALEMSGRDPTVLSGLPLPAPSSDRLPLIYYVRGAAGAFEAYYPDSVRDDFDRLSGLFSGAGFEKTSGIENADAAFEVYRRDTVEVTLGFWKNTGELFVCADEPAYMPPAASGEADALTEVKLIDPGLEYDGAMKGMCYIIQAADRSFTVIDSGDDDPVYAARIYSLMKENLPEGKRPLIRSWFLTHAHADHTNGFIRFSEQYRSQVDCLAVYSNFPVESYQSAYDSASYINRIGNIEKAARDLGAVFAVARTGQSYDFAGISVSVIGSVDDMFMTGYDDLDETSLTLSVRAGTKKILFSGDSGPVYTGQYTLKRYTSVTLACDICQASSHGVQNSVYEEYYRLASALVYLWPCDRSFYDRHTPNRYILSDSSARILFSFEGPHTLILE